MMDKYERGAWIIGISAIILTLIAFGSLFYGKLLFVLYIILLSLVAIGLVFGFGSGIKNLAQILRERQYQLLKGSIRQSLLSALFYFGIVFVPSVIISALSEHGRKVFVNPYYYVTTFLIFAVIFFVVSLLRLSDLKPTE